MRSVRGRLFLSLAVFGGIAVALYLGALIDAQLTPCPEIAAGERDGLSGLGQSVSLWPIGAECGGGKDAYTLETASWYPPVAGGLLLLALALPAFALLLWGRRRDGDGAEAAPG